jgi:hypothetical protein
MIQEAFQQRLNATAPTAGHHGYAPAPAFCQNAFEALAAKQMDDKSINDLVDESADESINKSVATQVAALTYQSHITANTAANTSIHQEQQMAHLTPHQQFCMKICINLLQGLMQLPSTRVMKDVALAVLAPADTVADTENEHAAVVVAAIADKDTVPPCLDILLWPVSHPSLEDHSVFHRASLAYRPPIRGQSMVQAPPYSTSKKQYANWNICYSYGFDVADGHTSMMCPFHMHKPGHDMIFFATECSTKY